VVQKPRGDGLGHARHALVGVLRLVEPARAVYRHEKFAVDAEFKR
jgi:hypothetical protein